jgi:hypothetical protein
MVVATQGWRLSFRRNFHAGLSNESGGGSFVGSFFQPHFLDGFRPFPM